MSSAFRIDGLISGMNTTDMITQMLALERRPLLTMQQQQAAIRSKKAVWQDLASRVQGLQTAASALLQPATLTGSTVSVKTANAPLTATAGPGALSGTYSVLISQVATGTVARSTGPIGAEVDTTVPLAETNLRTAVTAGRFSINGVAIDVDPASDSLDDVVARINAAGAGVSASVVQVDGRARLSISAEAPGDSVQLGSAGDTSNFLGATGLLAAPRTGDTVVATANLGAARVGEPLAQARLATPVTGSGTLTINGVEIDYDAERDSLTAIINRINASAANVVASYDPASDRLQITNKQTGSIAVALSDTGDFLAAMRLDGPAAQTLGSNATYSLDGGATWRYSTTNTVTDAIPGVTLTFSGASASPVEFTVGADVDGAVAAIRKFVDQYNAVVNAIRTNTGYDAANQQGGALLGDSSVLSLASALRDRIISPAVGAEGPYQMMSQIGISFGAWGSAVGTTNTLQIDEAKLRAALQDNPQAVASLFGATSSASLSAAGDIAGVVGTPTGLPGSGRYDIVSDGAGNLTATFYDADGAIVSTTTGTIEAGGINNTLIPGLTIRAAETLTGLDSSIVVTHRQGIIAALNDLTKQALGSEGLFKIRETGADAQIKELDNRMQRLMDRLDDKEARLYKQFAAMEAMLARMQSQSAALSTQLAALMNNNTRQQ